jgi:hypothetical protein
MRGQLVLLTEDPRKVRPIRADTIEAGRRGIATCREVLTEVREKA